MTTDGGLRATPWSAAPVTAEAEGISPAPADAGPLIVTLQSLRASLNDVRLGLGLRGAEEADRMVAGLAHQIDDYLLPRLLAPEMPPLLVIGGSTGGGKSTLLNTVLGAPVSPAGVLRPTTRSPVLVCHPAEFGKFVAGGPLPALPRSVDGSPGTLRVLDSDAIPAGLALVDTPDVDSVESSNRQLAGRLLSAADLWIFVTTAARYADAVPWDLLRSAVARGAAVAVVLSRVNHLAHATVSTHLRELLRAEGLGAAPLFVIEQSPLDEQGLLPEPAIRGLRSWIGRVAASPTQRTTIIRQTLSGALAVISDQLDVVADATDAQRNAVRGLRVDMGTVFSAAQTRLRESVEDGVLFRGDVVGHWQEYAGNGGLLAILQARAGDKADPLTGAPSIRAARVRAGLVSGVVRLFRSIADEAATELTAAWQKRPGGAAAASGGQARLDRASADAAKHAENAARAWLDAVDSAVASADGSVRAASMPVLVAAALQEGSLPVGREVDVAGGTVTLSASLLADVFEDPAVQAAAREAREDLLRRLTTALAIEQQQFGARLDELDPAADLVDRLRDAGRDVDRRRGVVAALFADPMAPQLALEAAPPNAAPPNAAPPSATPPSAAEVELTETAPAAEAAEAEPDEAAEPAEGSASAATAPETAAAAPETAASAPAPTEAASGLPVDVPADTVDDVSTAAEAESPATDAESSKAEAELPTTEAGLPTTEAGLSANDAEDEPAAEAVDTVEGVEEQQ